MRLSVDGFARLTAATAAIADECCEGRVVAITEGGYDLGGLASCLRAVIPVLNGETSLGDLRGPTGSAPHRGLATIDAALPQVRKFWQL
jgi:acetoin utilization deacetylase AcuC-like enzyme